MEEKRCRSGARMAAYYIIKYKFRKDWRTAGLTNISAGKKGYSRRFESNYAGDTQWTRVRISEYD